MSNSTLLSVLLVLPGVCAIVAGLMTIFFKETARKSEQWNRDFGARRSSQPSHWLFQLRIPAIYRGLWLILIGLFFLWSMYGNHK